MMNQKCIEDGRNGEELVKMVFENAGYRVKDFRNDYEYQEVDIDFGVEDHFGIHRFTVEVKTDNRMNQTGNIVIEAGMQRKTGYYRGWYYKCLADVLCFYDNVKHIVYLINWSKLKGLISEGGLWEKTKFTNYIDNCTGYLYLIPIEDLTKFEVLYSKIQV